MPSLSHLPNEQTHMNDNSVLFSPVRLGDLQLANRIAMAPMTRARAPERVPNELMIRYYAQRAGAGASAAATA